MSVTLTDTPAGPRIHVPMNLKRRSGRKRIIMPDTSDDQARKTNAPQYLACGTHRDALVIALARGFRWKGLLDEGRFCSVSAMAKELGMDRAYVARVLRLTLLAPDVVESILDGIEPDGMSLETLRRPMSMLWEDQRKLIIGTRQR